MILFKSNGPKTKRTLRQFEVINKNLDIISQGLSQGASVESLAGRYNEIARILQLEDARMSGLKDVFTSKYELGRIENRFSEIAFKFNVLHKETAKRLESEVQSGKISKRESDKHLASANEASKFFQEVAEDIDHREKYVDKKPQFVDRVKRATAGACIALVVAAGATGFTYVQKENANLRGQLASASTTAPTNPTNPSQGSTTGPEIDLSGLATKEDIANLIKMLTGEDGKGGIIGSINGINEKLDNVTTKAQLDEILNGKDGKSGIIGSLSNLENALKGIGSGVEDLATEISAIKDALGNVATKGDLKDIDLSSITKKLEEIEAQIKNLQKSDEGKDPSTEPTEPTNPNAELLDTINSIYKDLVGGSETDPSKQLDAIINVLGNTASNESELKSFLASFIAGVSDYSSEDLMKLSNEELMQVYNNIFGIINEGEPGKGDSYKENEGANADESSPTNPTTPTNPPIDDNNPGKDENVKEDGGSASEGTNPTTPTNPPIDDNEPGKDEMIRE